jgi:hypothetical protein
MKQLPVTPVNHVSIPAWMYALTVAASVLDVASPMYGAGEQSLFLAAVDRLSPHAAHCTRCTLYTVHFTRCTLYTVHVVHVCTARYTMKEAIWPSLCLLMTVHIVFRL